MTRFARATRLLLLLMVALLAAGPAFAAKKDKKAKDGKDEPERMYDKASKSLSKGYNDDAIVEFEKLRNSFPFSRFAVEAELKIADALFKKKEYGEAADAYRTFAKLHPKHEKVDYASYRVGLALYQEAPRSIDRDQSSTEKALEEFRAFITTYPDSKYADDAAKKVGEGRDRLAGKELYVGRYYVKHKKWRAAKPRLEAVVERYPDSSSVAEATFMLGKAQFHLKEKDAAVANLNAYLEQHPGGKWTRDARKMLARMGSRPAPKAAPEAAVPAPSPVASPAQTP